jgi:predicted PurR-regulated permease PerM
MFSKKVVDYALIVLVYFAFAYILWPFAEAIVFAALFAFALNPLLNRLMAVKKFNLTKMKSITILVFSLIMVLFVPLILIILKVAKTLTLLGQNNMAELPLFQKMQSVFAWLVSSINRLSAQFDIDLSSQIDVKAMIGQGGQFALTHVTTLLSNIPEAVFQFLVFIAMLYFFLMNRAQLKNNILKTELLNDLQLRRLVNLFQNVCNLVLVSTIIVAFAQAFIVSLASAIVGYDDVFIIFLIAFFLSFLPVIGSAPITIALIAYSGLNGHYGDAIIMTIAAVITSVADNIIRTYLFSAQDDSVHPIITLLGIIGSISVFGILGLFLGPIITELASKVGLIILDEKS